MRLFGLITQATATASYFKQTNEICFIDNNRQISKNELSLHRLFQMQNANLGDNFSIVKGQYGWEARATKLIKQGDIIIDIARQDQINIEHVIAELEDYEINERFDCVEALAILLALEAKKEEKSKYYDYIQILPKKYDTLLENWPASLDPVLPPYLLDEKRVSKKRRQADFEKASRLMAQKNISLTYEEYSLAIAWVFTRYKQDSISDTSNYPDWLEIEDGDCGSMAPIFDMLNHAEQPNCEWSADEGSKIWAERDIELGEELFISYGEHGNDQLVSSYGFTLNRADDPYFYIQDGELIQACQERLGKSVVECNKLYYESDAVNPFIDADCELFDIESLQIITNDKIDVWEEEFHNQQSHEARQLRLILYIMYKRDAEINNVLKVLEVWLFPPEHQIYKKMIYDIIMPEKILIAKCQSNFEKQALKLENIWK